MKMLINGKWVDKDKKIEVRFPYDNSLVDTVPQADKNDVLESIKSAKRGFEIMRKMPSFERSKILLTAAKLLEERKEKFANFIVKEVGKTIKEARMEVGRAILTLTISAEESKRISGETVQFDSVQAGADKIGFYIRVPLGVVLAITPFNVPLTLGCHKVGPAIAAGNSVILKPASKTPLSSLLLAEVLLEAGLPEESLQVITGSGNEIGELLITSPEIKMISFTGSDETGKYIMSKCGLKKVCMELGSNAPVIIMDDADLSFAIPKIITGAFSVAGQICISIQRMFVHEKIYEQFLEKFVSEVKKLKVGDPFDETTNIASMITEESAQRVEKWIKEAVADGAKDLANSMRNKSMLTPAVLIDVKPEMKVFCDEVFAPLVVVTKISNLEEGVKLANKSKYGLQGGIFTRNIKNAFYVINELEVGGVMINEIPTFRMDSMPYGGVKESGIGREGVKYAIAEMTEIKLCCFSN